MFKYINRFGFDPYNSLDAIMGVTPVQLLEEVL